MPRWCDRFGQYGIKVSFWVLYCHLDDRHHVHVEHIVDRAIWVVLEEHESHLFDHLSARHLPLVVVPCLHYPLALSSVHPSSDALTRVQSSVSDRIETPSAHSYRYSNSDEKRGTLEKPPSKAVSKVSAIGPSGTLASQPKSQPKKTTCPYEVSAEKANLSQKKPGKIHQIQQENQIFFMNAKKFR